MIHYVVVHCFVVHCVVVHCVVVHCVVVTLSWVYVPNPPMLGSAKEARFDCTIIHWIKASFPVSVV